MRNPKGLSSHWGSERVVQWGCEWWDMRLMALLLGFRIFAEFKMDGEWDLFLLNAAVIHHGSIILNWSMSRGLFGGRFGSPITYSSVAFQRQNWSQRWCWVATSPNQSVTPDSNPIESSYGALRGPTCDRPAWRTCDLCCAIRGILDSSPIEKSSCCHQI